MKKLLILAGVIALTSSLTTFAQETAVPEAQGPCPIKKECPGPNAKKKKKIKKMHCEAIKQFEEELKLTDEQKAQAKQIASATSRRVTVFIAYTILILIVMLFL